MSLLPHRLASAATLTLLPVCAWQGRRVRATVPSVPPVQGPPHGRVDRAGPGAPLRVVLLGESPVAGVGAPTHAEGLGGSFATALADRTGRAVHWRVVGRDGATVAVARRELVPTLGRAPADLAVVAFGVNDTLQLTRTRAWQTGVLDLLDAVRRQLGPVPVVVSGVPPLDRFPALPRPLSDVAGQRSRLLDRALGPVLSRRPRVVRAHAPVPEDPALFCADGFHPGPVGYARWGEVLADGAAGLLG